MSLPTLKFELTKGLQTKASQENVSGLVTAQNVDTYERTGCLGKVTGSSRKSDTAPAAFKSLHYFEGFNLLNTFTRLRLGVAGTTLYRINADQTLTSLGTIDTAEPLYAVTAQNRLHLTSANNDPIKVDLDGSVTNWGVKAPGQTRTTLESFDSHSVFTINSTNTKANSTDSQDGGGSTQVNKTSTSVTTLTLTRTGLALDLSGTTTAGVWLFVPSGSLAKLATSGTAVQVSIGETSLTAASHFRFSVGDLADGWNLLTFDPSSADATTGVGATLADVNEIQFEITFSAASQTQSGFRWDWFYKGDRSKPTVALGASGNVDSGAHTYKVSFLSRYGKESNLGDASSSVTSVGSQVSLSNIPTSSDSQVVARRIYRDFGADTVYRLVTQIDDNTTTTYTDNTANSGLSSTTGPEAGGGLDNSPPERMAFTALWSGYIFGVLSSARNTLVYSDPQEPEIFPTLNSRSFPSEITALVPILGSLLVFSSDRIYAITGGAEGAFSLRFDEINSQIGCVGPRAVTRVKNAIFFWADDGPRLTLSGVDIWSHDPAIRDLLDALDKTTFSEIITIHDRNRYRILNFVDGECFVFSYGQSGAGSVSPEGAGVDSLDPRLGSWHKLSFPAAVVPTCFEIMETSADTPEVWMGSSAGIAYLLGTGANWANGSIATAMEVIAETTYEKLIPGDDERQGMLRYFIIRGKGDAASTWSATLSVANDAGSTATNTTTFDVVIGPGITSKKYAVPKGMIGIYTKLKLQNSTLGETGVIESSKVEFVPRPARGIR